MDPIIPLPPRPSPLVPAPVSAMAKHTLSSIFWSILGIVVSGLVGGIVGWFVITSLGWAGGVAGALVAAAIAMVVATGAWIAITVVLRSLGIVR